MRGNELRLVLVPDQVEASDSHCNNSCQHMAHPQASSPSSASVHCDLFDAALNWDKRRKYHGYKRATECKDAEQSAKGSVDGIC
jgi:hypothetical protein